MCSVQGCNEVIDGARGKKQVCRPHVRTWGFSEANVLFWKSTHDIVGTFWPPAVIRRPGNRAPLPPSLRLWCYAINIGKIPKVNKFSSPNIIKICTFRPQHGMDLVQSADEDYWRHFRFLRVVLCHLDLCLLC